MNENISIAEILEKASKLKKKEDKINFLRSHDNVALRTVLCFALHPAVKVLLPEGAAPYKKSELADDNWGMLYTQHRRLYLFCEGGEPNLNASRREYLFIQFLESLHPKDAELMEVAKDKKLPYKTITKSLIEETFPGIFA